MLDLIFLFLNFIIQQNLSPAVKNPPPMNDVPFQHLILPLFPRACAAHALMVESYFKTFGEDI